MVVAVVAVAAFEKGFVVVVAFSPRLNFGRLDAVDAYSPVGGAGGGANGVDGRFGGDVEESRRWLA